MADSLHKNPDYVEVLTRNPSLNRQVIDCLLAAKATGTVKSYVSVIKRFQVFCDTREATFPDFTSDILLEFILTRVQEKAAFNALSVIKPAICYMTTALGKASPFTPFMDLMLAGAKRKSRALAEPVKKAGAVGPTDLQCLFNKFILPHIGNVAAANPMHLRTVFRLLIEYHTLCRFSCFAKLQARHFEPVGNDICITFPSAKNDQLHQGRSSYLVASDSPFCPVRLTHLYFRCFHLSFGLQSNDKTFLNFQLRRHQSTGGARIVPIPSRSLSASQATADLRKLYAAAGITQPARLSDKSFKMAGVTAAFAAGASAEDVMHAGRWESPDMPLHYRHNSADFKKAMASKIPVLATQPSSTVVSAELITAPVSPPTNRQ